MIDTWSVVERNGTWFYLFLRSFRVLFFRNAAIPGTHSADRKVRRWAILFPYVSSFLRSFALCYFLRVPKHSQRSTHDHTSRCTLHGMSAHRSRTCGWLSSSPGSIFGHNALSSCFRVVTQIRRSLDEVRRSRSSPLECCDELDVPQNCRALRLTHKE